MRLKVSLARRGRRAHAEAMKRLVCAVFGHRYVRIRYPGSPDGYYLRCDRCAKERDDIAGGGGIATGAFGPLILCHWTLSRRCATA